MAAQGSYLLGNETGSWPHLEEALYDFLLAFIDEYKNRLIEDGKPATGNLVNSINFPQVTFQSTGYEGSISLADYWKYVEHGRRPGKFPPPNVILNWVKAKPVLPRPNQDIKPEQLAFLIGRKIAREGIEPGNQMDETFDIVMADYEQRLSDAIALDITEMLEVTYRSLI